MASLFDFFIDRENERRAAEGDGVHAKMRRVRELLNPQPPAPAQAPPPATTSDIPTNGTDTSVRPRLVANPIPSGDPMQIKIDNQRAYTDQISNFRDPNAPNYNPVTNNDRGVWGRIGDVLREALISAGQAYNSGSGTSQERLLQAVGGGISGGVYGGFHPQADEERQRLYNIAQSQQEEQRLIQTRDTDQRARLMDEQIQAIPARIEATAEKQAADRQSRARIALATRKQRFDPAVDSDRALAIEAGVDPDKLKGWDWSKPNTKTVNGVTYQYANGEWQATGLPTEQSREIVKLDVQVPVMDEKTGEITGYRTETFNVPSVQAARFSSQISAAGLNAQSRERSTAMQQAGANSRTAAQINAANERQRIRNQMAWAVKQYDTAVGEKKTAEAQRFKLQLEKLQFELDALDEEDGN